MRKLQDVIHHYPIGKDNGLVVDILNYKSDYVGKKQSKVKGMYLINDSLHIQYFGGSTGKSISEFTPHLRSMSSITKSIIHEGYNNNKPFVPMEVLGVLFQMNVSEYCFIEQNPMRILSSRFLVVEWLLNKHFNIFNIPISDYIEKK